MKLLDGIKVIDFTRVISGPFSAMILADLGAEVIKVETPKVGDELRHFAPMVDGESLHFNNINRNKRSITLDLKNPASLEVMHRLVAEADIIVENFKPGVTKKLKIDYDEMKKVKPDIIYASISGYGQTGPASHYAAYDLCVEAMSGLMSVTGDPRVDPVKVGVSITDFLSGLFTTIGILAALHRRDISGQGEYIDTSMMDCGIAVMESHIPTYTSTGKIPSRLGNRHPAGPVHNSYKTKDGMIVLSGPNNVQWARFCKLAGNEALATDPEYDTMVKRLAKYDEIDEFLGKWLATLTVDEAMQQLVEAGIAVAPVLNTKQVVEHPQVAHRNMVREVQHPRLGPVKMQGYPSRFLNAGTEIERVAPALGEDTEEIILSLGYTQDEYVRMKEQGLF